MNEQKTVLIAGATGSIGGAAAFALAKRNAKAVILGRNEERLMRRKNRITRELNAMGLSASGKIDTLTVDFADFESVRTAAQTARKRYSKIHGLVLSVGAFLQNGPTLLKNRHEIMFATNVTGPFLFTELLIDRLEESEGMILHVIAPFYKALDWNDLESIKNHKPMSAFNRTKTCNRIIAGETARRYSEKVVSVAYDPTYVIDKKDPSLKERWPKGFDGFVWRMLTLVMAKHPSVAGEPIAQIMLGSEDKSEFNGKLFKLNEIVKKPDRAMNDEKAGKHLWEELLHMTH